MSHEEMLKYATCFSINEIIKIEKRNDDKWAIVVFETSVIDKNLKRHYEPLPSQRTKEFNSLTRFSLKEAFDIANQYKDNFCK